GIPLFPTLLQSSSVHFKAERLWMLRLLSAGSNLADDAKIYKRGRVLELALAFCSSPVSDFESKVLVLKVLENCVKLPVLAHHLEIGIIDCCCKQHAKLMGSITSKNLLKMLQAILAYSFVVFNTF
ncbi:hypothetical protein ACJX0J_028248, partial [Zea mays]